MWKLVRSCLTDEDCQQMVEAGQRILEEVQDSLSETERGERLRVETKQGASILVSRYDVKPEVEVFEV